MIDQALAQVTRYIETQGAEGIGKLRIELPPRHGKSVKVARLFPSWIMGRNPNLRLIIASHGAQLSEGHSRFIRNTIRSEEYASIFPTVALSDDSAARDAWDLAAPHLGGLLAVGTGGSVTGRGAGLIVADDLIKSREEYESATQRDKLWVWWTDDLSTRKEPGAAVVFIGTRWGTDDVAGRLEQNEAGEWTVIKLPALAETNDPLGRERGAALWPARFSRDSLLSQRKTMGDYSFSALYQQNPVSISGNIFKREKFKYLDYAPSVNIIARVRYWDLALSEKQSADYTVGVLLGVTDSGRYVIEDVQRFQLGWKDAKARIKAVALADGIDVRIGIEKVTFQTLAVLELLNDPDLHEHSIQGYPVHQDKLTRALPFSARVDAELVDVVRAGWTQDYVDELCMFNQGKNDDQVDGSSGAYTMFGLVGASLVYDNFNRERVVSEAADYNPEQLVEWTIKDGSLPGLEERLPRVILICQKTADENGLHIIAEYYDDGTDEASTSIEAVLKLPFATPHLCRIDKEATLLKSILLNHTLFSASLRHSIFNIEEGIRNVRQMLNDDRLKIHPRCERLITEFERYRFDDKTAQKPLTAYSQGPEAVSNAVWLMRRRP